MPYEYDKIREYYHALDGLIKLFTEAAATSAMVGGGLVDEYEDFLSRAQSDLPNLLLPFSKAEHFSHNNGGHSIFYRAGGIRGNMVVNLAKLKTKLDTIAETPVTETRSFAFVTSPDLRSILERDYQEAQKGLIAGNWKSVILVSGGSIEAILLDMLQRDDAEARASSKAPTEHNLEKWNLNELIEVAVDTSKVESEIAKLSHSVREYRNLIHPGVELRTGLNVGPEEAKIAVEVLNILIRELSR